MSFEIKKSVSIYYFLCYSDGEAVNSLEAIYSDIDDAIHDAYDQCYLWGMVLGSKVGEARRLAKYLGNGKWEDVDGQPMSEETIRKGDLL